MSVPTISQRHPMPDTGISTLYALSFRTPMRNLITILTVIPRSDTGSHQDDT